MKKAYSILFVGDLNEGGRSLQRYETLKMLGHQVSALSYTPVPFVAGIDKLPILARILWKLKFPPDATKVNRAILTEVCKKRFDLIWIDRGVTIRPSTLQYVKRESPESLMVSCSEDDMYAWHSQTYWYRSGLKYYDIVFTTKVYNLAELKMLGARQTSLFLDAYDERLHRKVDLTDSEKERLACDVGFIGSFETDRAERMLFLAEHGIQVNVYGNGWGRWKGRNPRLIIHDKPIYGDEYVKAINAAKVNLCFLRKINRDEVTSRSVEIPACEGFMLGERTKRHLDFFEEGKEAEFFDSASEMLEKVRYYLKHDAKREQIARSGRGRCVASGYSMRAQLGVMLCTAFSLRDTEKL